MSTRSATVSPTISQLKRTPKSGVVRKKVARPLGLYRFSKCRFRMKLNPATMTPWYPMERSRPPVHRYGSPASKSVLQSR